MALLYLLAIAVCAGGWLSLLPGWRVWPWRIRAVGLLASGMATECVILLLLSAVGIEWHAGFLLLLSLAGVVLLASRAHAITRPTASTSLWAAVIAGIPGSALCWWIVMHAQATSFDLLFFWGTKAQRFALFGGLDPSFLGAPENLVMHPDYPPLYPLIVGGAHLFRPDFEWFAALATTPLFHALACFAFVAFASSRLSRSVMIASGFLFSSTIGYLLVRGYAGGNAEALLTFFATTALAALLFAEESEWDAIISIALVGVVWTKVEGVVFLAVFFVAVLMLHSRRSRLRRAVFLSAPATVLLLCWVAYAWANGLQDAYGGGMYGKLGFQHLDSVISTLIGEADLGVSYAPWALLIASLFVWSRRAAVGVVICLGYACFLTYTYLHGEADPNVWIIWSAERVLIVPLASLIISFTAAHRNSPAQCGNGATTSQATV